MSILGKDWVLRYQRQPEDSLWSSVLKARQIDNPGHFFASAQLSDLHDPFLLANMHQAVQRIQRAIHARERVVIYGDYDVDGTSGSAILIHTLRFLGADVSYRIPHRRKDGYGLHNKYVDELATAGVRVLITVDCGIACGPQVARAQEQNMDVIITDHHSIPVDAAGQPVLPPAFALLHPKLSPNYPFKHLSGSGVAFKLACALLIASDNADMINLFTDLASLGTVADCVPLIGENRSLLKLGLKQMRETRWEGLRALLQASGAWGKDFSSATIGFQVGPRINAAGRIDNAYHALQTLLEEGPAAHEKAAHLEQLNTQRQELMRDILQNAEAQLDLTLPLIIAAHPDWPSGVVGLIASRLQEKYHKPAFILEDRGDHLVGSARSLPGFHCVRALDTVADLLTGYGGHEQAAGFHIKKAQYPEFQTRLQAHAAAHFAAHPLTPQLLIDCTLQAGEATLEQHEKIQNFAPFGIQNPKPRFLLQGVTVQELRPVGDPAQHLQLTLKHAEQSLKAIAFRWAQHQDQLRTANQVVVQLERNTWKNRHSLQLKLLDAAYSSG